MDFLKGGLHLDLLLSYTILFTYLAQKYTFRISECLYIKYDTFFVIVSFDKFHIYWTKYHRNNIYSLRKDLLELSSYKYMFSQVRAVKAYVFNPDYECFLESCSTLCDPVDCSPPGSSVHGISQARTLEWVAISSSRGSSRPRDWTLVSCVFCIGRWILNHWAREAQN